MYENTYTKRNTKNELTHNELDTIVFNRYYSVRDQLNTLFV